MLILHLFCIELSCYITISFQSRSNSRVSNVSSYISSFVMLIQSVKIKRQKQASKSSVILKHQNQVSKSSVNIKHQNQASKSSVKIKCQNQASKSSVKIKCQNQTSKSNVKIKRQNQMSKSNVKIKRQNQASKSSIIKSLKHCFKSENKLLSSVLASWFLSVKCLFFMYKANRTRNLIGTQKRKKKWAP